MPIEPTGPLSLPLANLRTLVAACPAFQSWVGAADPGAAEERIHLVDFEPPAGRNYTVEELDTLRPYAVVDEFAFPDDRPGGDAWVSVRHGSGAFVDAGKLLLRFCGNVPPEDEANPAEARLAFMNAVGAVVREIQGLGGGDTDYLSVHRIARWEPYQRASFGEAEAQGDFYLCSFVVTWGP